MTSTLTVLCVQLLLHASAPADGSKLALVPPAAPAGINAAALAKALDASAEALRAQGFQVVMTAEVAATCKAEDAACLAKAAQAVGASLAATLGASRAGANLSIKLLVIDAADGSTVASGTGLVPKDREKMLSDAVRKQAQRAAVALAKRRDERKTAAATATKKPEAAAGSDKPAAKEDVPPTVLLSEARKAFEGMEYESAAALATRLLAIDGLGTEIRLDAYVVQASSLAITAEPGPAEIPFRLLLRARPDFDLPPTTSPKILGVFRKVQAEEKAITDQVRSVARRRLVEGLQLLDEPPAKARGGRALPFALRLRDPTSAVSAFEVPFRKQGESAYSALALKRDPEGTWRGAIPAEWTASDKGFVLEYYLLSRDENGPLLTRGAPAEPLSLAIAAGSIERSKPIPRWALWTGVALTGAAGIAAGGVGLGVRSAQKDYNSYAQRSLTSPIDGSVLQSKAAYGKTLSNAALGTAIAAGVLAVATLAILPFTKDADALQTP